MTIQTGMPVALNSDEVAGNDLRTRSIVELVATTLCGLYRVDGHFVRMNATVGDDGCIDVELTRVSLDGENVTMRVVLHATAPVPVPPAFLPQPRTTA